MAITHTWSIDPKLKTTTEGEHSDVVSSVRWNLLSEETVGETTYSISSGNEIKLNTNNIDSATFIAYADLTQDQVVNWAKAAIDAIAAEGEGVDCSEWEAGHERNIAKQKNPPSQTQDAPW